jgi:hypothetical protein
MKNSFIVIWHRMYINKLHREINALHKLLDPTNNRVAVKVFLTYLTTKELLDVILSKIKKKVASVGTQELAPMNKNVIPYQYFCDYIFCFPTVDSDIGGVAFAKAIAKCLKDENYTVEIFTGSPSALGETTTRDIADLPFYSGKIIQIGIDNSRQILEAAKTSGSKVFYLMQGLDYLFHENISLSNQWINHYVFQYSSILTLSPYLEKCMKKLGVLHAYSIPTYINHNFFHYNGETKEDICLISLRDNEFKGARFLLPQVRQIQSLGLKVIAFGEYRNLDILEYCDEYVGRVNSRELGNLMRRSKFLIDPSMIEGVGLTALEGMACGVIPLNFRRGGSESILETLGVHLEPVDNYLEVDCFYEAIQKNYPSPKDLSASVGSLTEASTIKSIIKILN